MPDEKHAAKRYAACLRMDAAVERHDAARLVVANLIAEDGSLAGVGVSDAALVTAHRVQMQSEYLAARQEVTNALALADELNVDTPSKADCVAALALEVLDCTF